MTETGAPVRYRTGEPHAETGTASHGSPAMSPERIEDIVAFVHAADARSFTVAAERLGLSRSTVGKRITRLEARLGARLLHRTTRSVTLTDEGANFHGQCAEILEALEAAEAEVTARGVAPSGRLRIDLPVSLGRLQVLPVLQRYMRLWPAVSVNISFSDRYVDLVDEGIDVAVRVGGMVDSNLVSRKVAAHTLVTCAAPDYLARRGTPVTIEDLPDHDCLTFSHGGRPVEWRFRDHGARRTVAVGGPLTSNNAEGLRDLVVAGLGIGQLATFLISDELRDGRLVPILAGHASEGEPLSVVYPVRRLLPPKVTAFVDLLVATWQPRPPWDL
ncbi:LysR family transcriptional regulator [Methylobacterium sp. E-025]|uniref:LysR family transcriptional regulator n=1 Tax=Methylobacterium sp. E-025 TaxID=2836561 RepID=UPI001FB87829|nr:LysR family transcriptional regulator [Methylobacterium sp. E-025]MCJ2113499.1 LysR family transcriptional regulator [Methylobacterium sp. E-025]